MHKIELNLDNSRSDGRRASHPALTRLAYSPSEGAQVLGISRSKIYELIAAGDLKASSSVRAHCSFIRNLSVFLLR